MCGHENGDLLVVSDWTVEYCVEGEFLRLSMTEEKSLFGVIK